VLVDQYGNELLVDMTGAADGDVLTYDSATGLWLPAPAGGGGGGAPDDATYLVGAAHGDLSAEIVAGATPGGELGGTWGSPTVAATHSGSAHHAQDHSARHEPGGADAMAVDAAAATGSLRTLGTGATQAAGGAHTHGGGGSGGEWDLEIRKSADEDVASNTVVQDDNHLTTTPTSGVPFYFQFLIPYSSPVGGGTPELKYAVGEDTTAGRGTHSAIGVAAADGTSAPVTATRTDQTQIAGTAVAQRLLFIQGVHTGAGGVFRFLWAQSVSGVNVTRVHLGAVMRLRYID
jgi:hypothetical protein